MVRPTKFGDADRACWTVCTSLHLTALCHYVISAYLQAERTHSSTGRTMVEITIRKRPRTEAVITQRKFFKKTARGKVIKGNAAFCCYSRKEVDAYYTEMQFFVNGTSETTLGAGSRTVLFAPRRPSMSSRLQAINVINCSRMAILCCRIRMCFSLRCVATFLDYACEGCGGACSPNSNLIFWITDGPRGIQSLQSSHHPPSNCDRGSATSVLTSVQPPQSPDQNGRQTDMGILQ